MAYTLDEYQATVRGMVGASESWTNTWTFQNITAVSASGVIREQLELFYLAIDDYLSQDWSADVIAVRNLGNGVTTYPAFGGVAGLSSSDLLPTQLAVRVSLDDLEGHRGGPFISGWTEQTNTATGLFASTPAGALQDAIEGLASGLQANGMQLAIDRPTAGTTVAALQARIGQRWDVIRKRSDDTPESYLVSSIA